MNLEKVTVEDCVELFYRKGKVAIINDGQLIGFQEETSTQSTSLSENK